MEQQNIKEILTELGYTPTDEGGSHYRCSAIYREGDCKTALRINARTGYWWDFVEGRHGPFKDLIALTLKEEDNTKIDNWIKERGITFANISEQIPKLKIQKLFDDKIIKSLVKDHSYWTKRGISEDNLIKFKGGVCLSEHLKNRYVFPIFNNKNEIVGLAGRDITGKKDNKWKLMGQKKDWVWPAFLNSKDIIGQKEVILVESIGDGLALYESGVKNFICLFGVEISWNIINFLLRLKMERIIIATNNDSKFGKSNTGNASALKIQGRLERWMDTNVEIRLPAEANDINDLLLKNGTNYIQKFYGA